MKKDTSLGKVSMNKKNETLITSIIDNLKDSSLKEVWKISINDFLEEQDVRINSIVIGKVGSVSERIYTGSNSNKILIFNLDGEKIDEIEIDYETEIIDLYITNVTEEFEGNNLVVRTSDDSITFFTTTESGNYKDLRIDIEENDISAFYPLCQNDAYDNKLLLLGYSTGEVKVTTYDELKYKKNKVDLIKGNELIRREEIVGICGSFKLLNGQTGIIVGYKNGILLLYDNEYNLIDKHDVEKAIEKIFFLEEGNALIVITDEYEILYFTFPSNGFNFKWYYKTDSLSTSVIPNDGDGFFILLEDDGLIYKFNNKGNLQYSVDPSMDGTSGQIWDNNIFIASNEGELAKYTIPETDYFNTNLDELFAAFNLQSSNLITDDDFAVWFNSEFSQPDREPYFIEFLNTQFINNQFGDVFKNRVIYLFDKEKYDTETDSGLIEKIRSSYVLKENFKHYFAGTSVYNALDSFEDGKIIDLRMESKAENVLLNDPSAQLEYISLLEELCVNRIDVLWKIQLAEDDEIVDVTLYHDPFLDDKDQILAATKKGKVALIDTETSEIIWQFNTSIEDGNINNVIVSDICNDGKKEIIIGLENCRNSVIIITDSNTKYDGTKVSFKLNEVPLVWGSSYLEKNDYCLYQAYCYSPGLANKTVHKVGCFDFDSDGVDDLIISSEDGKFNVFYFDRDIRQNIKTSKIQIIENEEEENEDILDFCFSRNADDSVSVYTGSQTGLIEKLNLIGNRFEKESSLFSNERYGIEAPITDLLVTDFNGEKLVLYSSEDNFIYCLNEFLDYKWSYKADGNITSIAITNTEHNKYIYCASDDSMGKLIALDFHGNKAWDFPFFKPLQKINIYLESLIIADSDGYVYLAKIINADHLRKKIEIGVGNVKVDKDSFRYKTDKYIRLYSTRKLLEENKYTGESLKDIKREIVYNQEFESTIRREVITLISDSLLANKNRNGLLELLVKPIFGKDTSPEVRLESAKAFIIHFDLFLLNNFDIRQILNLLADDEDECIIAFLAGELGGINLEKEELVDMVGKTIINIISENKDEDWILNEAASSIGTFLNNLASADLLHDYIFLLCKNGFEKETFERIRNKIPTSKIAHLFDVYIQILFGDTFRINEAYDKFVNECDDEDKKSYKLLIDKIKSFVNIIDQIGLDDIIGDKLLALFSNSLNNQSFSFVSIINKLNEYENENNISEKIVSLSFASDAIATLVKEKSELDVIDKRLFVFAIEEHLNELISKTSRFLREKVELDIEMENREIYLNNDGIVDININITNKGFNKIEEIEVNIKPDSQLKFTIIQDIGEIGELVKSQYKKLYFKINPKVKGALDITFLITYKGCLIPITEEKRVFVKEAVQKDWIFIPNPYTSGIPIENDDVFVGRESLIQEAITALKKDPVFVMGHRRMGKTSLIKYIQRHYLSSEEFVSVFISAEKTVFDSMKDFLFSFCRPIADELEDSEILTEEEAEKYLEKIRENGLTDFGVFFDRVLRKMRKVNKTLVLIIDEYPIIHEAVEKGQVATQFVSNLRGYMQNNSKEFKMIYSGASSLKYLKSQYSSNIMGVGKSIEVSFLDPDDVKKLISKPLNNQIQIEDSAFQYLMEMTYGQPFLIQVCLSFIVDKLNKERKSTMIFKDAIEEGLSYFLEQAPHLQDDWNNRVYSKDIKWSEEEEKIAKAYKQLIITSVTDNWRKSKNGLGKEEIFMNMEKSLFPNHKLNRAIFDEVVNILVGPDDMLKLINNLYFIKVGFFREWIISKMNFTYAKTLLDIKDYFLTIQN